MCFSLAGTVPVLAQVKTGDVYSYDVQFSSDYPSIPNYYYLLEVTSLRVSITTVDHDQIYARKTITFKNGTETSWDDHEQIVMGYSSPSVSWPYLFYGPNLTTNDSFFYIGNQEVKINETVIMNYAGIGRETNHLIIDLKNLGEGTSANPKYNEHQDIYFDKKTGIAVEVHILDTTSQNYVLTKTIKIKESNVWAVPEFPSLLVLSVLMISIPLIAIAYKNRTIKPPTVGSSANCNGFTNYIDEKVSK